MKYTNRDGCDYEHPDEDDYCCLSEAEYAIWATFEPEGGGPPSVHAPMYLCEWHFSTQLPKYAQKWRLERRLLTLAVVSLRPTAGVSPPKEPESP